MAICFWARQQCLQKIRLHLLQIELVCLALWLFLIQWRNLDLSIDEVDALTGPIIGRPKSATFRTADVVGIDTLVKVAKGVEENCPNDEAKDIF